jgi:hypothetical protein
MAAALSGETGQRNSSGKASLQKAEALRLQGLRKAARRENRSGSPRAGLNAITRKVRPFRLYTGGAGNPGGSKAQKIGIGSLKGRN